MSQVDFTPQRLNYLLTHENSVIRHDVDYDPWCALQMARLEGKLGVHATYYIRPLTEYGSSTKARTLLAEVPLHGHDLGVHVSLLLDRDLKVSDSYMAAAAEDDFDDLSKHFSMTRKVSYHAPPSDIYWRNVKGFDHAMKPEWEGRYIADSRGVFRFSPEQALEMVRPLQLNLHPEWWFLPRQEAKKLREREALKP